MNNIFAKRNRLGFTLAEVLTVIGIIVILLALSVAGFVGLRKNIQITEYDDIARQIYIAAQNELTRLSVGGVDSETAKTLSLGISMGDTKPADYNDSDGGAWSNANYKYATSNTDVAELLLPSGSVTDDVRLDGHYVIEYNTKTNIVYGVFYSEDSFTYSDLDGLRSSKTKRKNHNPMIGYYGGSAVQRDEQNYCATPALKITNDNELKLTITGAEPDYSVSVTITDASGNFVTVSSGDSLLEYEVSTGTYTLLMDSLDSGKQFKDLFSALTPGDDLDITVTFSKSDNSLLPSSATEQTNSLFATREAGTSGSDTVTIAYARHLQNLDTSWSNVTSQVTAARQTEDIDWTDATTQNFVSIDNANLTSYDGNYQEIQNLTGTNGLFKTTKADTSLTNIRVVNPTINAGTGTAPVGGLVGTAAAGTTVTGCGVYYYSVDNNGSIDFTAYTASGCGITASSATVGGLIGKAEGTAEGTAESSITVTSSFAALPKLSGSGGAGLIGDATYCEISLSYAACDALDGNCKVNYFLSGSNNTITKCYAVGNLAKKESASFVSSGNTIRQSYYAVGHTEYTTSGESDLATTEYVTYDGSGTKRTYTYEKFLASAANDVGQGSKGEYTTFSAVPAPLTHPYRQGLDGRAYPYPGFYLLEHYGSWPTGDGTVTVTVLMKSSDASNTDDYRYNAGHVQVYELDEKYQRKALLFDNRDASKAASTYTGVAYAGAAYDGEYDNDGYKKLNTTSEYVTFEVTPGTKLEFVVNGEGANDGNTDYTYVSMEGLGNYPITANKATATLSGVTTVTVNFKPSTYALTANWPTVHDDTYRQSQEKSYSVQYSTETGSVVLTPKNTAQKVSTDSDVTITVNYPSGTTKDSYTPVVTYTYTDSADGSTKSVELTGENGKYKFKMPAADTTIDVRYEKNANMVQVGVEYYVQGTTGAYPAAASKSEQRHYTVGTPVDEVLAAALSEASGKEAWEDNGTVQVLDYSYFQLYQNSSLLASTEGADSTDKSYVLKQGDSVTLKIYIARKQYELTLAVGEKIQSVSINYKDGSGDQKTESDSGEGETVTAKLFYGQSVTAKAVTEAGQTFTVWEPNNTSFRQSSAQNYTFTMPYYSFMLTASAKKGYCLVTLEMTEDGESWLASSDSRQADPVTLYLVDTRDNTKYELTSLTDHSNSYVAQALVPAVEDLGEGYKILIHYEKSGEEYTYQTSSGTADYQMTVRAAVTKKVEFYTVTYRVKENGCTGTVPNGGTYPVNSKITVKGNTGLLKYGSKLMIGWKDEDATNLSTIYSAGDEYKVTGKTYFFAQWANDNEVYVIYTYDETIEDISGELPTSRKVEKDEQTPTTHTVEAGNLKRPGYTFAGWSCSYGVGCVYTDKEGNAVSAGSATADHVHQAGDVITLQDKTTLTLKAEWEQGKYTVTYIGATKTVKDENEYTINDDVTVSKYDEAAMGPIDEGKKFVGWATTKNGTVRYSAGEKIKGLTDNLTLYAVFADKTVRITYHCGTETAEQLIAWGASAILNPGKDGDWTVTAWSENKDLTGQGYLCEEGTAHTVSAYSFTPDESTRGEEGYYEVPLYANTGKVYNYNQQTWYGTLYDAVVSGTTVAGSTASPNAKDTLIVYRDTEETKRVEFMTALYVIASGDRTVKWTCETSALASTVSDEIGDNEFRGCMFVNNCAVTFGESETVSGITGTLTFDANQKCRVMALKGEGCVFTMVDGVTLTNGLVSGEVYQNARISKDDRQYMGGGVYAADGAYFNMAGGTISYCQATAGGGVYILGAWINNKWGNTSYKESSYDTSAKFSMGGMETPDYYSSDKIYYQESSTNKGAYEMVSVNVTAVDYKNYYVTTGNPQIIYNKAVKNNNTDGGGVYILGAWIDNKWGKTSYKESSYGTSAKFSMGGMETPENYSSDKIYYQKSSKNEGAYEMVSVNVTAVDYKNYYVTTGNPQIIYNKAVKNNNTDGGGGIVLLEVDATSLNLFSGEVSSNTATGLNGGGIILDVSENNQQLRLYEVEISHNSANNGGGIFQYQGTTFIYNGDILQNYASGSGGGIYVTCAKTYKDSNSSWSGNHEISEVLFYYGTIRGNETKGSGGGIYLTSPDSTSAVSVYIENGQILDNSATGTGTGNNASNGGGIYIPTSESVSTTKESSEITEKEEVYKNHPKTVTVTINGGEIRNNDAYHLGGGVYVNCSGNKSGVLYLNGGYLSGNTVEMDGTGSEKSYKCDICLAGGYKKDANVGSAYAAITTQKGDLANRLENNSDDPIYIVGYSGKNEVNGRKIVMYDKSATFNEADADCFAYTNGRDGFGTGDNGKTKVYVTPTVSGNATSGYTYEAPLILSTTASGQFTVYFDYNYDGSPNPVTKYGTSGDKILYSDVKTGVTRDGYDLIGWATTADAKLEDYIIYYQDGAAYMSYSASNKHWMYKYEEESGTWYKWDSSAKDWTTDFTSSEIDSISSEGEPAYTVTSAYSQTLYAQWQLYSVTYDLGDAPSTYTVTDGSKAYGPKVKLSAPDHNTYIASGVTYTFKGWSTQSGKTALREDDTGAYGTTLENGHEITLTESVKLYAVWQPDTKITITYNENGGSNNSRGTHTEIVQHGSTATAWDNTTEGASGTYSRINMILVGWATNSNGEVAYAFGAEIPAEKTKSDLSLYAVWKNIVTVKFNANGGESTPSSISSYAGATVTLPAAPTRDGYTFDSWKYETTTCGEGAEYTIASDASGTIEFTAQWTENDPADNGDGKGSGDSTSGSGTSGDGSITGDGSTSGSGTTGGDNNTTTGSGTSGGDTNSDDTGDGDSNGASAQSEEDDSADASAQSEDDSADASLSTASQPDAADIPTQEPAAAPSKSEEEAD